MMLMTNYHCACVIIITICHLVTSESMRDAEMLPTSLLVDVIVNVRYHFGPRCIILHASLETGQLKWYINLQKLLIASDHLFSTAVIKIQNNFINENNSLYGCHRPLRILPFVFTTTNASYLYTANGRRSNKQDSIWLQFLSPSTDLDHFFDGVDVPFDCEFLVAQRDKEAVTLTEVFRVREDLPLQRFHFGTWRPNLGLQVTEPVFHERRHDLQGIVLKAVVIPEPSAIIVFNDEGRLEVGGYVGKILRMLSDELNFIANVTIQEDGIWGNSFPNGTWDGMVGEIISKKVDISVNNFFFTSLRSEVLDLTIPVYKRTYKLFIRSPTEHHFRWSHFTKPFSPMLWIIVGGMIPVLGVFVTVLYTVHHRDGDEAQWACQLTYYNSFFCIVSVFLQQGTDAVSGPGCCHVVFVTALLTSMILLAAYSAILVSFLAVEDAKVPFDGVTGLLADTSYGAGVFNIPAEFRSSKFNTSGSTDIHKLRQLIEEDRHPPKSVLEGLIRVCHSKYAFLAPVDAVKTSVDKLPCQIEPVPNTGLRISQAFPMTKNSPYRTVFNHLLKKLKTSGVMARVLGDTHRWTVLKRAVPTDNGVQLDDVAPVLVLLLAGVTLAAAILAAECATHRIVL